MTHEIITDRFEVEKLAEDIFVSDDTSFIPIDYADLRKLKQTGTFRLAIVFNIATLNDNSIDELINTVKAMSFPPEKPKAVLMNIIANDNTWSLLQCSDITNLRSFLMTIRQSKDGSDNGANNPTNCLWTVSRRTSLPDKTVQIHLMFTFGKSETDKLEDEKVEQLIREYHRLKCPTADIIQS